MQHLVRRGILHPRRVRNRPPGKKTVVNPPESASIQGKSDAKNAFSRRPGGFWEGSLGAPWVFLSERARCPLGQASVPLSWPFGLRGHPARRRIIQATYRFRISRTFCGTENRPTPAPLRRPAARIVPEGVGPTVRTGARRTVVGSAMEAMGRQIGHRPPGNTDSRSAQYSRSSSSVSLTRPLLSPSIEPGPSLPAGPRESFPPPSGLCFLCTGAPTKGPVG